MCRQVTFPVKKAPADGERRRQPVTTEIQVLRLGDIYVLGLPGEVLVEVGMEIRKKAGIEKLLIATVANDTIGYVCHSQAYDQGGYEPESGDYPGPRGRRDHGEGVAGPPASERSEAGTD